MAAKYRRHNVPLAELIAEGNFGLTRALQKFDPERGVRFVTYAAYWVRCYILSYVVRSNTLVGGGPTKLLSQLRRERARFSSMFGEAGATDELLAERVGVTVERLQRLAARADLRDVSLDAPVLDDATAGLVDRLCAPDNQEHDLSDKEMERGVVSVVRAAVSGLDPRERFIAEHRLLAEPAEELSLAQIGTQLGVSRERVRQLEKRLKAKLRSKIPSMGNPVVNERLSRLTPTNGLSASSAQDGATSEHSSSARRQRSSSVWALSRSPVSNPWLNVS